MYINILILLTIILSSIIFLIPVIVHIMILKDKNNDKIIINFKTLFGLARYNLEIPIIELDVNRKGKPSIKLDTEVKNRGADQIIEKEKSILSIEEIKKIQDKVNRFLEIYYKVVEYIYKKITCHHLLWKTEFGTGDAAVTGIASGILWTIKGHIITFFKKYIQCKDVELNIVPQFNKVVFKTAVDCIISIKIGHIIIASIKFAYTFIFKGGERNG